ncbi:hypothetical protein IKG33_00050 [Candidatus Saccharibacteria bacterium]|nr:hypothetical protein [Candidatus Saccharibacteria bacterium]
MSGEKSISTSDSTGDQDNKWSVLFEDERKSDDTEDKTEKLIGRAKLYRKFGGMALLAKQLDEGGHLKTTPSETGDSQFADHAQKEVGLENHESLDSPEDVQAEALIEQIEAALELVDKSLGNQIDYSIINHKQINTRDALEHELQSGTSIPELDIRFDKDGKPWISHSPRAGARFFFSKPIHKLSSKEVAGIEQRLSLEDGLGIFKKYYEDNPDHKVVLELKELGPSPDTRQAYLESIRDLLEQNGLTEAAIFATLSPSILKATHAVFPENSKILNGGICPVISYDIAEKSLEETPKEQEFAMKAPNLELFFSNSTEIAERPDGYGKQTGYLWTRLPLETVKTLARLNERGKVGAASLTLVNKFANILDKLSPKTAKKVREHYAAQLNKLGIRKQVAIAKNNPVESLKKTKEQMGDDAIIYSDTSPGEWAADLPEKPKQT